MVIDGREYPKVKSVEFPTTVQVAFAVCSKKCGCTEWVVFPSEPVCSYCHHKMKIITKRRYTIK